jgi:hypothetical protein
MYRRSRGALQGDPGHLGTHRSRGPRSQPPRQCEPQGNLAAPARAANHEANPMLKIQRLELHPIAGRIARVWVNLAAKPTRRTAKAERVAMLARTDWQNGNTLVRVRT